MQAKLIKYLTDNWQISAIVILSVVVRLVSIDRVPPALNWDEISHGYNAYSILKTGKDEWGESFPVIFRAYGDYKLPVYIYLTALSEFFFGLNAFAVRLPSILAGIGTVIFTYLLVLELFSKNKKHPLLTNHHTLAMIASLLVAIEPWSLFLSRGAFEANVALFLFVSGVYFFLKGISHATRYMLPATFLLALTVWTYNSYRVFTPLMLVILIILYKKEVLNFWVVKNKKIFAHCFLLFALFFVPMFKQLSGDIGQARYEKVAIIDEGAINKINELRNQKSYSPVVEKLLYNRPVFFVKTVAANWVKYFTGSFLFLKGGDQFQYNVQNHGLIYLLNVPFIVLGLLVLTYLAFFRKSRSALMIFLWVILAPIPASITRDSPHTLRAITMLPIPMILSAVGLVYFVEWSKKVMSNKMDISPYYWPVGWKKLLIPRNKALYLAYFLLLAVSFNAYLTKYFGEYKNNYSWSWQYGYGEAVNFVNENYDNYDKIIFTKKYGEPHIFLLYYWPWSPRDYRVDGNLIRYSQDDWFWVDRFDKFYFVNDWDIPRRSDQDFVLESGLVFDCDFIKCLLVTSPGNVHQDWKLLKTINFLDDQPAFEIYEN